MSRNPFAAALAADFRANGIFRTSAEGDSPKFVGRQSDGRLYEGPVCFFCNNVPDAEWNGHMAAIQAIVGSTHGIVKWLDNNDDETVLAALDALNA